MSPRIGWNQVAAWVMLIAGLILSIFLYLHFLNRAAGDAALSFEEESRDAQRAIETRLASYAGLLLGLRGLHGAAGGFDEGAFDSYIDRLELLQRYPAVRKLDYEGPTSPSHDLFEEIRDGGDVVLAGLPPSGEGDAAAVRVRLAVYDRQLPTDTVARRHLAFAGSVGMDVSLAQIIRDAISAQTLDRIRISMHAKGRRSPSEPLAHAYSNNRLFDTSRMAKMPWIVPSPVGILDAPLSRTSQIVFGGAVFELAFTAPANAFVSPLSPILPIFALLAGATISLLLFSLVNSLVQSRRGLELAVAERTRDLEAINQALHDEMTGRSRLEREIFHLNVDERRRFGQHLHDNIGQRLAAMGLMLESLTGELQQRPEALALVARISGHIRSAIEHTRMLARGLNPVAVEAGGFASALARLAASTRESFRVDCSLEHDGQPDAGDAVLQHNLYRIAQQAITNAVTHGHASRIRIKLSHSGHRLRLSVFDNGIGMDGTRAKPSSGLGLKIMRYRCSVLGLDLRVESPSCGGTSIVVEQGPSKD